MTFSLHRLFGIVTVVAIGMAVTTVLWNHVAVRIGWLGIYIWVDGFGTIGPLP